MRIAIAEDRSPMQPQFAPDPDGLRPIADVLTDAVLERPIRCEATTLGRTG